MQERWHTRSSEAIPRARTSRGRHQLDGKLMETWGVVHIRTMTGQGHPKRPTDWQFYFHNFDVLRLETGFRLQLPVLLNLHDHESWLILSASLWISDHHVTRTPRITRARGAIRAAAMLAGYDGRQLQGSGYFPVTRTPVMTPVTPARTPMMPGQNARAPAMAPAMTPAMAPIAVSSSPLMAMRPIRRMSAPALPQMPAPSYALTGSLVVPQGPGWQGPPGPQLGPGGQDLPDSVPGPPIPVYAPTQIHERNSVIVNPNSIIPDADGEAIAETFQLGDAQLWKRHVCCLLFIHVYPCLNPSPPVYPQKCRGMTSSNICAFFSDARFQRTRGWKNICCWFLSCRTVRPVMEFHSLRLAPTPTCLFAIHHAGQTRPWNTLNTSGSIQRKMVSIFFAWKQSGFPKESPTFGYN